MNTKSKRNNWRSRAAMLLAAGFLAAAHVGPPSVQAQTTEESCGEPDTPPVGKVEWVEVPDGDSETSGTSVTLRITSLTDVPAEVRIALIADAGGPEEAVKKSVVRELAPRATTDVPVAPGDFDLATDAMSLSGQLLGVVKFTPDGACEGRVCRRPREPRNANAAARPIPPVIGAGPVTLMTPAIYFHRLAAGDPFSFYGENLLRSRHAGGDLTGTLELDSGASLVRHTHAGTGGPESLKLKQETNLPPVDDDGDGGYDPPEPPPDTYRVCFKFEVGLVDAGKTIIDSKGYTISEDHWSGVGKGSGKTLKLAAKFSPNMIVTGRGVMYSYKIGQFWVGPYYTDPKSGCANISLVSPTSIDLRVYSQFQDKDGNVVRVHDGIGDTFYWSTKVDSPKAGKTTVVTVGDYTGRSTLAATVGFSMYRWAYGNTGKQIDVAEANFCGEPDGAESSAHFNFADLNDGLAHIRIHDGTNPDCSASDHRRMKFIVSHELGHAWLLLRTKVNEPTVDSTLNDPTETVCGNNDAGYWLGSVEWSGIGFRESAAHLYATRVWNERGTDAVFSWFAAPNSVEFNPDYGDGGRLDNVCTILNQVGKSTNIDWLRFWWDIYAPFGADTIGSGNTIAQLYEDTVLNGGTNLVNYWQKLREAAVVRITDPNVMARFDCASSWNGIDNSGTPVSCSIPTPP